MPGCFISNNLNIQLKLNYEDTETKRKEYKLHMKVKRNIHHRQNHQKQMAPSNFQWQQISQQMRQKSWLTATEQAAGWTRSYPPYELRAQPFWSAKTGPIGWMNWRRNGAAYHPTLRKMQCNDQLMIKKRYTQNHSRKHLIIFVPKLTQFEFEVNPTEMQDSIASINDPCTQP